MDAGRLVAVRAPAGVHRVGAHGFVRLPPRLRRRCGIEAADRVLLAGELAAGVLVVYPLASLDTLLWCRPGRRTLLVRGAGGCGMNAPSAAGVGGAEIDAALLLLSRMGITPEDLVRTSAPRPSGPTFAAYVPVVAAAVSASSRRAYGSYWNRLVEHRGQRRIDAPTPSDIQAFAEEIRAGAVVRRNGRGGHSAVENFITALRRLYRQAVADGYLAEADNPASKVDKPRRLASARSAVPDTRLAEINQVAATTGNDPALDTLILRLHIETACRRGGALALRPRDLDRRLLVAGAFGTGQPMPTAALVPHRSRCS